MNLVNCKSNGSQFSSRAKFNYTLLSIQSDRFFYYIFLTLNKIRKKKQNKKKKCLDLVEEAGRPFLEGLACGGGSRLGGLARFLLLRGQRWRLAGGARKSRVGSCLLELCTHGLFMFSLPFIVGGGLYDHRRDDLLLKEEKCGWQRLGKKTSVPSKSGRYPTPRCLLPLSPPPPFS